MQDGWIKLHRRLRHHTLWQEKPFTKAQAWIDMILRAEYNGCDRGCIKESERKLAMDWGWAQSKVHRFLLQLKQDLMVDSKSESKMNHVTILNYDKFQQLRIKNDSESESIGGGIPIIRKEDKNKPSGQNLIPRCPHQKIIELYHEILPELRKVKIWSKDRRQILQARWRESKKRQSLEWWKGFFEYVSQSAFLMGKKKDFQADLEWLIRPKNFVKVVEGKYHR